MKWKEKRNRRYPGYTFYYCGEDKHEGQPREWKYSRHPQQYKRNIEETHYINKRMMRVALYFEEGRLHIINIYVSDVEKPKAETTTFYNYKKLIKYQRTRCY